MPELNHADKWAPEPLVGATLQGAGVTARVAENPRRSLVSGDLAAFARICAGPALRIARDRALVLGDCPLAPGWHAQGFAVSGMTGAYALVTLAGPGLAALIAKATTPIEGPSRAITFAGIPAIVDPGPETLGLHIERGLLAYLWTWAAEALKEPA